MFKIQSNKCYECNEGSESHKKKSQDWVQGSISL